MWKFLAMAGLVVLAIGVSDAQAGWRARRGYYYYQNAPAATATTTTAAAPATARGRSYSIAPGSTAWPYYPNYGNWEGTAYSPAASLRPGQVYGTFGLRPADARARGNY